MLNPHHSSDDHLQLQNLFTFPFELLKKNLSQSVLREYHLKCKSVLNTSFTFIDLSYTCTNQPV